MIEWDWKCRQRECNKKETGGEGDRGTRGHYRSEIETILN